MKKLNISAHEMDAILFLMENQNPLYEVYIDLDTGQLVSEEWGDLSSEELNENPERYCWTSPISSSEGYRLMVKFVFDEVKEEDIADLLHDALSGNKPFRRFRDALRDFPKIFARYEDYRNQVMIEDLKDTLAGKGYELVIAENSLPGDTV